ncbi:PqqD family protein [Parvimonas micra]|uniref:PqqD family protein n=1 Tax=Parvimonas micra TaxID=33033 RepID=UPI0022B640F4|nr:PqqD family protein [Parvimonas micra]MCZ7409323.1 PqqD family protein [Parvimonas micra]
MNDIAFIKPQSFLSWQILEDRVIIKNEKDQSYFEFKDTGFEIIRMILCEEVNIRLIVDRISKIYNVDFNVLLSDVEEFLSNLIKDKLVYLDE